MYPTWTFATPRNRTQRERARRMPLTAAVQLFLRFEAWQLGWTLNALNISETGLVALFAVTDEERAEKAGDLETLIAAEPEVRLQIDHNRTNLFSPVVWARMARSTRVEAGLELAFQFLQTDPHILALLEDLLGPGAHDQTPSH